MKTRNLNAEESALLIIQLLELSGEVMWISTEVFATIAGRERLYTSFLEDVQEYLNELEYNFLLFCHHSEKGYLISSYACEINEIVCVDKIKKIKKLWKAIHLNIINTEQLNDIVFEGFEYDLEEK